MSSGGPNWLEKFWSVFLIGELGLGRVIAGVVRGILSLLILVGVALAGLWFLAVPYFDKIIPYLDSLAAYLILFVIFYLILRALVRRG